MSGWAGAYQDGRPWAICDRCGWKVRLDELQMEWTELKVCKSCWDPRPVHLSPPAINPAEGAAIPGARPETIQQTADADIEFKYHDGTYFIPDSVIAAYPRLKFNVAKNSQYLGSVI